MLEEDIVIFTAVADGRMFGIQGTVAELAQLAEIQHLSQIFIIENFNFLYFMGSAEAVKEMLYRQMTPDGGQMRDSTEIHAFLHAGRGKLCPACLAAGHYVLMVTENGDGGCGNAAGSNMHHSGHHQPGDAVHGRDHQHETLSGSIGGCQRTGFQRSLHGCAGTRFCLHFHQFDGSAEEVFLPVRCPLVDMVGHRTGGRNRIDCSDLCKRIACVCGGFIAVHGFSFHKGPPEVLIT